jgi:pilus assembly protein CpaB
MKPARLTILAVAVVAAGLAGYLAMNLTGTAPRDLPIRAPIIEKAATKDVLVAKNSLPVGSRLKSADLEWKEWPADGVVAGFMVKDKRPDAIKELTGAVVRLPIFAGEPVRPEKIVDSDSHIMSSLLPSGKRAVAIQISVATAAGGFILPNDRVDVIMVRRGQDNSFTTDTVLSNIRVLAIDQQIQESPDGKKTAVGATATLELSPKQAQIITVAQQMADKLTLALRSTADARQPDSGGATWLLSGDAGSAIQVIRAGAVSSVAARN